MSLSSCPKCWDTPCTCGHEYKTWSEYRIEEHIKMLKDVLEEKKKPDMGLYRIYWKSGGNSLAAIGNDRLGNRWVAPTNWASGSTELDLNDIEKLELIQKHGT